MCGKLTARNVASTLVGFEDWSTTDYSALHCRHSNCFGTAVNRDQNALKSILLQTLAHFLDQDRHPVLCRQERRIRLKYSRLLDDSWLIL